MMAVTKPEYREANGFIAEVIRTERRKTADIRVEDGAVSVVVPENMRYSDMRAHLLYGWRVVER